MQSVFCELAIKNALAHGNALLKFISPNDVGLTGGHQWGFYLPKSVYPTFTPQPPTKGIVTKHDIRIVWQDDYETNSVITWYGAGTRSEYRLTRFDRGFPYLTHDMVGDLLVLTRVGESKFVAFILDLDDDIREIQATLGVEVSGTLVMYQAGVFEIETEDECIDRYFRKFAEALKDFPQGDIFSAEARNALKACLRNFDQMQSDDSLMKSMEAEYQLFRMAERQLCQGEIIRVFKNVDDFLSTASSILNRRKARAGRSLENHVEQILKDEKIPYQMRSRKIDGTPDIVIPNEAAYLNEDYPLNKLFIIGVKTTCKDRWRQVLNEGKRVPTKHILTIQPGISTNQLNEMHDANVRLVVPQKLHRDYPRERDIDLLTVHQFVDEVKESLK
jgi:type II restriction enzyme